MTTTKKPKGRPRKYSEYEQILADYPAKSMTKRPVYVNNIGIYRGKAGDKVFIKVHLRHKGKPLELPKGHLTSWDWTALEAERDKLQGRADRNEPLEDTQSITFREYATGWLEIAKTRQKSYQTSMYCVERQLIPYFGTKDLSDINVRDVNLWQAKRMGEVKPATVKRDLNMLKSILNTAIREELIEKNPCDGANKIKGIQARLRYWTAEELMIVLDTAEAIDPEFKDCILWALYSAMRRGEILNMKWDDLLRLPNGEMKIHLATSKSDHARQIPCNTHMLAILERQSKRLDNDEALIFPIASKTFQRRMDAIKDAVKDRVKDIRFHDLRTLNITNAICAGVDPKTLIGITGHTSLQMIDKHYSVLVSKAVNEASQRSGDYIDALLQEAIVDTGEKRQNNVIVI